MRVNNSALWLCVGVGVLLLLVALFARKSNPLPPLPVTQTNAGPPLTQGASSELTQPLGSPANTNPLEPQGTSSASAAHSSLPGKGERMREGLAALNDSDIALYGRVVDQFAALVVGARILGVIGVNNGTRVGTDRVSVTTDANGSFSITGYKGKDMGITITRSGYALAATSTYFVYSSPWPELDKHIPAPADPVIITMWKLQWAEPVVGITKEYKLPPQSQPLFLIS